LGRCVDDRWPDIATDFVEVHPDISIEDWQFKWLDIQKNTTDY
jgi:hypothetical protein